MKNSSSMHKNVQEMCDCYATTDPLKEMSTLSSDSDAKAAAAKWLALAALQALWLVWRRAPRCVVGMGGYAAGPAGATSTSTSWKVAPPPMSASSWLVTALALRPPGHIFDHQMERPTTRPGRAASETSARARKAPRSLKTRTICPGAMLRAPARRRTAPRSYPAAR